MSLLLLIDGYNVIAPVAPPARGASDRWLHDERMRLVTRLTEHLEDWVRKKTCVVFDASNPPRDRPSSFTVQDLEVKFAVGYPEADDLIEEMIAAHSSPKRLAVVSADHRIQQAARRRGCAVFDSEPWIDHLLDGTTRLASGVNAGRDSGVSGRGQTTRQGSDERPGGRRGRAGESLRPDEGSDAGNDPGPIPKDEVERWMRDFGF